MQKIRCLIVDDEPPALDILESHIRKIDQLELIGKCRDAVEAQNLLHQKAVDLLFLDIEMPELNGLELLQSLRSRPRVVLTTAFREYALEGFEQEVTDYLLKPIRFQRFLKAVNKVIQFRERPAAAANIRVAGQEQEDYLFVNINKKMHRIFLADVLYIESLGNYVRIHTGKDKYTVHRSLTALEDLLPERHFLRIHKSFIVSLAKIDAFTSEEVEIAHHNLPLGRHYRLHFEQAMRNEFR